MSFLKINTDNYPTVLFYCSPSLGMLDSCLSVLKALSVKLPNAYFVFLTSKEDVINQIYLDSELIKISEKIFDKVVFRTVSGIFLSANTFSGAKKLNDSFIIKILYNVNFFLSKLKLKFIIKLIQLIFNVLIEIIF